VLRSATDLPDRQRRGPVYSSNAAAAIGRSGLTMARFGQHWRHESTQDQDGGSGVSGRRVGA
jgi:hypothetical protein